MSLRFLKAKPKLTLSKDKKVRSAPKVEETITDEKSQIQQLDVGSKVQSKSNKDIQERKEICSLHTQDREGCDDLSKQKSSKPVEEDGNIQPNNKPIDNLQDGQQIKEQEFQIKDSSTLETLECKADHSKVRENVDDLECTDKNHKSLAKTDVGKAIQSPQTLANIIHVSDINKEKHLCLSISEKSHQSREKGPDVIIENEKSKQEQNLNNLRKERQEIISEKSSVAENTKKVILPQEPSPEKYSLSQNSPPEKPETGIIKDSKSKTKSLSSYIKQLEGEKQQLLSSQQTCGVKQQSTVRASTRLVDKEKSPNTKKDSTNPNLVELDKHETKDPPTPTKRTPQKKVASKEVPPVKGNNIVSSSPGNKNKRMTQLIENKCELSIDKGKQMENKNTMKRKNVDVYENKPKTKPKVIDQNIKSQEDKIYVDIKPKTAQKQSISKSKCDKRSDFNKASKDITHSRHTNTQSILTKENIESIPIILSNPAVSTEEEIDRTVEEDVFTVPGDHMYAKLTKVTHPSSALDIIIRANAVNNLSTKPERSIASVKIKNSSYNEKKQKKHLNPSKVDGLNAFQRALLLEDTSQDEESEASECESRAFVDVNACTYNQEDELEEAPINQISYAFHDKELKEFSGLSLVTKFIKDENRDPIQVDTDPFASEHENVIHCEEKVIYSDNVIEIIDSNHGEMNKEKPQEILHVNIGARDKNKQKRIKNEYPPSRKTTLKVKQENCPVIGIKKEKVEPSFNTKKRKIKQEIDFKNDASELHNYSKHAVDNKTQDVEQIDSNDLEQTKDVEVIDNNKLKQTKDVEEIDHSSLKRTIKVKKDEDYEYMPDEEAYGSSSDLEIDVDERDFVIYGKKFTGAKKKISESIYHKRCMETINKISNQTAWKENLTVCDLIFYNPKSNPMTNPPDIAVVKKNEFVLGENKEKEVSEDEEAVDNPEPVPQLKISADGKLIIDPKSLIIEETGLKKSKERLQHSDALVESKYTIKRFDNLYTKRKEKRKTCEWAPEDTIMFYRAVNTIGTDFSMMASLFGNRTRADIKRKYKLEERKNPSLLSRALTNYNKFDIDELKSELSADKRRAEKIKKEEKDRQDLIKEEKRQKRKSRPRAKKSSVCGQLIQDCSEPKRKVPEYVKPPIELFNNDIQVCS